MIKKSERLTKAICNKGYSGNPSILPRIKIRVGGQESSPQSLTAYSLNRYCDTKSYKIIVLQPVTTG